MNKYNKMDIMMIADKNKNKIHYNNEYINNVIVYCE